MSFQFVVALSLAASPIPSPSADAAASAFLHSFKMMDERTFDSYFDPQVTMFFPDGPFPDTRVEGREAVLAAFHRLFATVRERGRTQLNVSPLDRRIQLFGNTAIVSFQLEDSETLGRRSIVMQHGAEGWRIVHFHASTVEKEVPEKR